MFSPKSNPIHVMGHFSGHTSKINLIHLLRKPKPRKSTFNLRVYFTEPSTEKKNKLWKSTVVAKTLNAFFPFGVEN